MITGHGTEKQMKFEILGLVLRYLPNFLWYCGVPPNVPLLIGLSLKQGTGNGGTGNEERGTGNRESLKGGISKRGNL